MMGVVSEVFANYYTAFVNSIPVLTFVFVLVVIGYLFGLLVKFLAISLLKYVGLDDWFENQNLLAALGNRDLSEIIGSILKWYVFFIFLKQAVELINLFTIQEMLGFWISFILTLIAAFVVLIFGMIVGRYVRNAVEATKVAMKKMLGLVLELMIVYVSFVMGIKMVGLPTQLLEYTFLIAVFGAVFAMSLMMGIGFGLALKDEAKTIVKEIKKKK
ncbi:MAG: hypothetical protein GX950_01480 [Candidatus Diapherotrites archaeon]|uniref:Mechanosensitive ion channel n=1 Tax=Candidatus Iainarchaeum sp. TaxID=3101447 RepID=A0A7K4BZ05_9ARCH|nr:hypothetical protein [Candidatus Diapherotrites archaeon]